MSDWKTDGDLMPPPVVGAVEYSVEHGASDPTKIAIHFDQRERRMRGVAVHGNTPFDVPFISELAPNLWQGGCEDGLVLPAMFDHVVSMYPWERYKVQKVIKSELYVQMYDNNSGVNDDQVWMLAEHVRQVRKTGTVLVHCQAGLNRSSLVAAASLMLDGMPADEAIDTIRDARSPACLCNPTFVKWLRKHDA